MEKIIPISDLQSKAKEIVDGVKNTHDPVVITQRGRPAVLIVNVEDYESLLHTADEMSYPDWEERLDEARRDSKRGRGTSLEKIKKKIAKRRS